jgi:hypothetical protein
MGIHDQFRAAPFDNTRFIESNRDLVDRMTQQGLFVLYDDQLNTLFVDVGPHRDGVLEPLADNMSVRVDPSSLELLGYEVADFRDDFLPNNMLFESFVEDLHLFQRPNVRINASESSQEETLRRLVAVA